MGSVHCTTEHVPMTDSRGHRVLVVKVRTFRRDLSASGTSLADDYTRGGARGNAPSPASC
jgi:hypothetical protein